MEELARLLRRLGIKFSEDGNRIRCVASCFRGLHIPKLHLNTRCLPHIINLSVKAGLKQITEVHSTDPETENQDDEDENNWLISSDIASRDEEYQQILRGDVIAEGRHIVTACRLSGQHREEFTEIIKEGNKSGRFGQGGLRVVALLRYMDIRWSSTYLMVDRVLEMYPVSNFTQNKFN
jgi:hypothetical protein